MPRLVGAFADAKTLGLLDSDWASAHWGIAKRVSVAGPRNSCARTNLLVCPCPVLKDLAGALFGSVHCPCSKICAHGRRVASQALVMSGKRHIKGATVEGNSDYYSGFEELQSSIPTN